MATKRIEVAVLGSIKSLSLDRTKPGKVTLQLELFRGPDTVEQLAALSDGQVSVEVLIASLQAEMGLGGGLSDRLRDEVEEAAQ